MADPVYRPLVFTAKGLFKALGLKFDIVGQENIPQSGGAVLAINHISFLDYAFAGLPADRAGHRRVRFMAKDGIFKNPVAGPLMRSMGHISVNRDAGSDAFRQGVRALKDGELLGVFPEGTMSRTFELISFKSGAVRMAAMAQVPIIPMTVFGGQRILGYGHKDFSRGKTIGITIGAPIAVDKRGDVHTETDHLRDVMSALLDETIQRYPHSATDDLWWLPKRFGGTAPTVEDLKGQRLRDKQADADGE